MVCAALLGRVMMWRVHCGAPVFLKKLTLQLGVQAFVRGGVVGLPAQLALDACVVHAPRFLHKTQQV